MQALLVPFPSAVRGVKAGTEGHITLLFPIAFTGQYHAKVFFKEFP